MRGHEDIRVMKTSQNGDSPRFETVMTLGPASADLEVVKRLARTAGRFRLNAAHLATGELRGWLVRLARLFGDSKDPPPIVIDLQGAKMRIGKYPSVAGLPERVTLSDVATSDAVGVIPVPHQDLFESVSVGETLTLNDGRVRLEIETVAAHRLEARVILDGPLSSFKGVNRSVHPIPWHGFCDADLERISEARPFPFVQFAFSFVHTGAEATLLRARTDARLVAKIERPEAMEHLDAISRQFDEVWFCRGDLAEQAGLSRLGALQHRMERAIPRFRCPVFLAGQVLEHMSLFPQPTRSEAVHLYEVTQRGWSGIVLSDETAIGRCVIEVADFLDSFFSEIESIDEL